MNSLLRQGWFCGFAGFLGRIRGKSVDANSQIPSDRSIYGDAARRDAELDSCTTVIGKSLRESTEYGNGHIYSSGMVDFHGQFLGRVYGLDRQPLECRSKDHEPVPTENSIALKKHEQHPRGNEL